MIPIRDLLNKIKWDKRQNPKDFTIFYFDRITKENKEIKYASIKKIEDNFLILDEETNIPLHRIRLVKRKNITVWKRPQSL